MERTEPTSTQTGRAPFAGRGWQLAAGVALAAMVAAAYVPAIHGGFIWDDDAYVTGNLLLRSWEGLYRIWFDIGAFYQYYPLALSALWAQFQFFGADPLPYHVTNVCLHAGSAVVFWRLLRDLEMRGAWFAAALFAVHPVCVESVAWVTEIKNAGSLFFALLALRSLVRWHGLAPTEHHTRHYLLGFALLVCALLFKTVVLSVPAVLLVVAWWKRGGVDWLRAVLLAPMLAVGMCLGLVTVTLEKNLGATGAEWVFTPVERILLAGRNLWFYAGKLAWPVDLTFQYPRWAVDQTDMAQYVWPVGVVAVFLALWLLRKRIGRGPLAGVLVFCGVLTPALGFFDVYPFRYSFVADHFQYHACLGLLALAGALGGIVWHRLRFAVLRGVALVVGLALLAALGSITWGLGHQYADIRALYQTMVARNPNAFLALNNLGVMAMDAGELDTAESFFRRVLDHHPAFYDAYVNLAKTAFQRGDNAGAEQWLRSGLAHKPGDRQGRVNLALAVAGQGRLAEAEGLLRAVLEEDSGDANAWNSLSSVLIRRGRYADAAQAGRRAAALRPDWGQAHGNLGMALLRQGEPGEAAGHLEKAVAAMPGNAPLWAMLGQARMASGNGTGARAAFGEALRLDPGNKDAAEALQVLGDS